MMSLYNGRNDNMIIRDNYDVNDSLVNGLCIARTPDGKVLFKKHNMVVNDGRTAIFDSLVNGRELKFTNIKFGNNISMTTRETENISTFTDGNGNYNYIYKIASTEGQDKRVAVYKYEKSQLTFTFSIEVGTSAPAEICEMGLFCDTDDGEKLFSRVVFDPIFCGPNAAVSRFTIEYVVYL